MPILAYIKQHRYPILAGLCAFAGGLFLASLYHRFIHIDDAWFADYSYQFAHHGAIRSELFRDFLSYGDKILNTHKCFLIQGGVLIRWFGLSPWILKALPLPYFATLLGLLALYQREFMPYRGRAAILFTFSTFILHALVFELAYTYRPEVLQACTGFASFYAIHRGLQRDRLGYIALAGVLAGLSAFLHLNGLAFMCAGGGLLVLNRAIGKAALFSGFALAVAGLYFFEFRSSDDWELFLYQFRHDPALKEDNFSPWHLLVKLTEEHMRLFRDFTTISFSVVVSLVLIHAFRYLRERMRPLLVYTLLLILAVAVIARDTNTKYYVLYMPFFAVIATQGIDYLFSQPQEANTKAWQYALAVVLSIFFIGHIVLDVRLIQKQEDLPALHARVATAIPRHSVVGASNQFVFNELEHYEIRSITGYVILRDRGRVQGSYWAFARRQGVQYAVLDRNTRPALGLEPDAIRRGSPEFQFVAEFPGEFFVVKVR